MTSIDETKQFVPLNIAVLNVSDTRAPTVHKASFRN